MTPERQRSGSLRAVGAWAPAAEAAARWPHAERMS